MSITRITLLGIAIVATSLTATSPAKAASYQHIDTLALRIQSNSAKLYHEIRLHYRHTAEYPHLISDASKMYHQAKHIHELAHHHGSLHHMSNDLRILDASFHHIEGLIRHIEFEASHGHFGHVDGHTGHVHRLLKLIECDIHHLRADIKALTRPHVIGHIHGHQHHGGGSVIIPRQRNFGEIRSGWTRGLSDIERGVSGIRRHFR